MATVVLNGITKSFGPVDVIKGIDLSVEEGAFGVFVGPSSCGKSTLLRIIAGLDNQTAGTLEIGGRDFSGVEPPDRGIAMVYQSCALYPHLTVRQNIGFGLSLAKLPKDQIATKVEAAAAALQLTPYLDAKPKALSGDQFLRAFHRKGRDQQHPTIIHRSRHFARQNRPPRRRIGINAVPRAIGRLADHIVKTGGCLRIGLQQLEIRADIAREQEVKRFVGSVCDFDFDRG